MKKKGLFIITLFSSILMSSAIFAFTEEQPKGNLHAIVTPKIFTMAKQNQNWKVAVATGKDAQVVFMNITPQTNPNNEIGMETHDFDQVLYVIEGEAKSIINGQISTVGIGDMILVPQGVAHNFINLHAKSSFKVMSVYSSNDIATNAVYKTKADEQAEMKSHQVIH